MKIAVNDMNQNMIPAGLISLLILIAIHLYANRMKVLGLAMARPFFIFGVRRFICLRICRSAACA